MATVPKFDCKRGRRNFGYMQYAIQRRRELKK